MVSVSARACVYAHYLHLCVHIMLYANIRSKHCGPWYSSVQLQVPSTGSHVALLKQVQLLTQPTPNVPSAHPGKDDQLTTI